jgi:thioesterase domain-containing protein/acyl carrier protein
LLSRGASLWNMYGPTETTIWSTVYEVRAGNGPIPIGRPIANTQIYVLDRHLQPVPVGVPGELYIGGDGLARGYLNRPELTAERFIPNPFGDKPDARLYKSGDLARYLPNGDIEYLGRIDHQVKLRGFRIELGEIETALGQHPAVREAVVLAREDIADEKRLVAYIIPDQKQAPSISELRSFLNRKLPDYMIPSSFVTLDALPLTPNGKVDRRTLPAPDMLRPDLEKAFVAPRDRLELQLTKIWEQVLGLQSIGVRDNFFELGGNSLLVVRLFAQIEGVLGKNLPLATLFQAPTVEQLANILRREGGSASWASLVAIQSGGSDRPFFCIPGNLGNVFVDLGDLVRHLGPDQPVYGLQDGIHNPSQIEALAAHYVDDIRSVQPEGPYLLGGVCSGGVIAFEMARQLQAKGQRIALLALIEPPPPLVPGLRAYFDLMVSALRLALPRFSHHSRALLQHSPAERGTYLRLKAKLVANMWAIARYIPQTYPGRVTLFLSNKSATGSLKHSRLDWQELAAGGLEVHVVPGSHDAITRTHDAILEESQVQILAGQLRTCIDSVLADECGSKA